MSVRIVVERRKIYPSRPRAGGAWSWLYEATGPDTVKVGSRVLPRRFDNRSIADLRRVLRRAYGSDVEIVERYREAA